jgi:hypothetical protein
MPFKNLEQLENITIPPNAQPGEARIVVGTDLPAPLDQYQVFSLGGPAVNYSGAIILYGEGDDTTYQYLGIARHALNPGDFHVHWGFVWQGVVQEAVAGFPETIQMQRVASGALSGRTRMRITTDDFNVAVNTDVTMETSDGVISVSGDAVTLRSDHTSGAPLDGAKGDAVFSDYPGPSSQVTINKRWDAADSKIRIRWAPSLYVSNADTGGEFAIRYFNGSVNTHYVTHRIGATINSFSHFFTYGEVEITGLDAGFHSFSGAWRRLEGTGELRTTAADDWVTMTVEEVPV